MNVNGLVAAIEHGRQHPRLPGWDREFRAQVAEVVGSRAPDVAMASELSALIAEWERAHG
jgi:hypothetical protein